MAESHKVIALISGGKDSIFSILHCLENGHKVVALGNLYPSPPKHNAQDQIQRDIGGQDIISDTRVHHEDQETEAEENDLNSFMYQTVGHTVIPLYEQALGIPLYRQAITGGAVQTDTTSYEPGADGADETESLVPLLRTIMAAHPEADALSTGAILSTYQRTRVESVALRLGLVPLSFLWKYPVLQPGVPMMTAAALLHDMAAAGLDARIIKVASGGLDESFLWENVASARGWGRLERAMARFGACEGGAVLGEGGEFETLVLDGPDSLFKGRIVVDEADRRVVREGGGAAWLSIRNATLEIKPGSSALDGIHLRRPELLESRFGETLEYLQDRATPQDFLGIEDDALHTVANSELLARFLLETLVQSDLFHAWAVSARGCSAGSTVEQEMGNLVEQLRSGLKEQSIGLSDVISVVILLRSMEDFNIINKIYGTVFDEINPPARVAIACGDMLPPGCNIVIQPTISEEPCRPASRKSLHVQSRSYWAPANIGPYSQAQAVLRVASNPDAALWTVHIAGQIPLVPSTMALPFSPKRSYDGGMDVEGMSEFNLQAVLSLQHLWRIGEEMDVSWWSGAVAYLSRDDRSRIVLKARLSGTAWEHQHRVSKQKDTGDEDGFLEEERDIWEERHVGGFKNWTQGRAPNELPDWSIVDTQGSTGSFTTPFFAAEVAELPRGAQIEWHAFLISHITSDGDAIHKCIVGDNLAYTTLMLSYRREIGDVPRAVEKLLADTRQFLDSTSTPAIGYSYVSYLDSCVKGLWDASVHGGIIPCRSLWDMSGKRLAAVLLFRT